jgi:transcriptional regulator with XRE-family HTH domain
MDEDRQLFATHPQQATLVQLREQRVKAGLTLRQAAKVLGIEPSMLSDIENGRTQLAPDLATTMAEAYGTGE